MQDYQLKDSGERRTTITGAQRDRAKGKGRFDLLPCTALERLAIHYEKGATKYADRNWEKGMPLSWLLDSAMRHIVKYMRGDNDEDHLVAAAWNLVSALEMESWACTGARPATLLDIGPYLNCEAVPEELPKLEPGHIPDGTLNWTGDKVKVIRPSHLAGMIVTLSDEHFKFPGQNFYVTVANDEHGNKVLVSDWEKLS
jgi:hypothetical protein